MRYLLAAMLLAALLVSCAKDSGPPVVVSELRILAPIPGSNMGVAYMKITNRGAAAITVHNVSSPQFERVEMHETTIADGVSRMRPIDGVEIAVGDTAIFEAGGKHLMLMNPGPDTIPGSPVTLEITHDSGLLIVSGTMQPRLSTQ